jgi:hypothetical protein
VRIYLFCGCLALMSASAAFGQQPAQPAGASQDAGTTQPGKSSTATKKPDASKQSKSASSDDQKNLADLLESKIRASWEAFKNKNKEAYGDFLTHDYMAVEDDGQGERTKMVVLREVGDNNVHDYKLQLFRTDPISPDAALVTYENVIEFPPKVGSRFEKIFISEIWVKRNGQWKSWRYQATKVK